MGRHSKYPENEIEVLKTAAGCCGSAEIVVSPSRDLNKVQKDRLSLAIPEAKSFWHHGGSCPQPFGQRTRLSKNHSFSRLRIQGNAKLIGSGYYKRIFRNRSGNLDPSCTKSPIRKSIDSPDSCNVDVSSVERRMAAPVGA